jgi:hypothetical protein
MAVRSSAAVIKSLPLGADGHVEVHLNANIDEESEAEKKEEDKSEDWLVACNRTIMRSEKDQNQSQGL